MSEERDLELEHPAFNPTMENPIIQLDVPIKDLLRCRWRDDEDSPEKIAVAIERISRQGFRGRLTGRLLPDGRIEQLNGHNRRNACEQMGFETLPFDVRVYTDEEALDIFLSDNMKEDGQGTGWALGAVRTVVPYYLEQGITLSEAHARLGDKTGLDAKDVERLSAMNSALTASKLSPAVKRLLVPHNAVEFWRKLQELMSVREVPLQEQEFIINGILQSPDVRGRIRTLFNVLLSEVAPIATTAPKAKKTPFVTICRNFDQLAKTLRDSGDDLTDEELLAIVDKAKYVYSLLPDFTGATESNLAVMEALADMETEPESEPEKGEDPTEEENGI